MFLWLKAFHLISMVAWFAGLFYLPRLFVYHTEIQNNIEHQRFVTMERKLFKIIMTPAMITTLVFGFATLWARGFPYYKSAGWLHLKITLVLLLVGYHHVLLYHMKRFAHAQNRHSARYFRLLNEVPTVFLFAIVLLAVIKPF